MKKCLIIFIIAAISGLCVQAQGFPPFLNNIQAKAALSWNHGIKIGLNIEYRNMFLIPQSDGSNFNIGYAVGPGLAYNFGRHDFEILFNTDASILGVGLIGADNVLSFGPDGLIYYLKSRVGFTVGNYLDLGFGWYLFGDRTIAERPDFFLGLDLLGYWTMPEV
jgi:hypothetical protein